MSGEIGSVNKKKLTQEEAYPSVIGVRQAFNMDEVAPVLTPSYLATLVRDTHAGNAQSYLTLAEEMEERDLHYRSVLGTRKHAIESLEFLVEPGDDTPKAAEIADDVFKTIIRNPAFDLLIKDALDALGKGFSVNEIIWDTSEKQWFPTRYAFRDPHWFEYDVETGRRLLLREGAERKELSQFKYVIHHPHLKSGLPIRDGLALPVSFYFMIKTYDVAGWAAFSETYGYPLRMGKYPKNASKADIAVLRSAVRNLGRDVGAILPDSMMIDVVNGIQGQGNVTLYERLANWCDKQISKGVLGQTMSTDAEGGQYKGDLHNEIRLEIRESDAAQLAATINRSLIRPYVMLNYGVQDNYPAFNLPVPRPEDIPALINAVDKLVPLGFKVKTDDLYYKLGLNRPSDQDDVLVPSQAQAPVPNGNNRSRTKTQLNREDSVSDEVQDIIDEAAGEWEQITSPLQQRIEALAAECNSYDEMMQKIPSLLREFNSDLSADKIALAAFKARALGFAEFDEADA